MQIPSTSSKQFCVNDNKIGNISWHVHDFVRIIAKQGKKLPVLHAFLDN